MTTLAQSVGTIRKPWHWMLVGGLALLIAAATAIPSLLRARMAANVSQAERIAAESRTSAPPMVSSAKQPAEIAGLAAFSSDALAGRKIIRSIWFDVVVAHPSEVAQQITAMAEGLGGYLVNAEYQSQNSATAALTIRVPGNRFEEARSEIRKLGLRVESERVDAQDVTRQYVDQDATIRNLRAEEAGYLSILKQAHTVKDMLAVSDQLSSVRGQIEQQQAEFNALSNQIETVAIAISLRTESEAQVFGLNWRPLYQLKLAVRDGLESIGNYAAAMITVLFYLPSVLLWVGTLFFSALGSWRLVLWIGRRWFGWKGTPAVVQS